MKQYINLKEGVNCEDLLMISPLLGKMLAGASLWCAANGIYFEISSLYRPADKISTSNTHQTGRAADIGFNVEYGWNDVKLRDFTAFIEDNYMGIGAISTKTNESRPIYTHRDKAIMDGKVVILDSKHIHLQVRHLDYYLQTRHN